MTYILIHGLGQDSSSWNKTLSHIEHKEQVICPELTAFLKEGDGSYENLYRTFSEYCDNISGPLNLCGLSLGAVLALNYTIDNPQKVKSLILIAAQYEMPKALLIIQNAIFKFIPQSYFKNMGMYKADFIKLTKSMMNLNFSEGLKDISCPVLVLCGKKDSANRKASKNLANIVINAKIQIVENAGHEVNINVPRELAGIINNFYEVHKL